ncbi:ATP-binding protein [Chitinophaga filiformis]|uniref:ligand-binding sensor domain-containing protein n=1 Tax=Chitinophaga filiformis TaxID=104663 RepID=UPI001F284F18|nr:sensor histidine kinase [Chitinophaga filiformis]MCF6405985.1 ATP-binding protein [Chitinophaga filiformis]
MYKARYSEQGQWKAAPRYLQISILLLICLLIGGTEKVCGQLYYFRHYQVENGLSNNAVICSLQDSRGFMWFGTKDGLNRFDGYTFKVFRHNPQDSSSIGSNFIHALYEGADGTLWVGTENGLYSYNNSTESFLFLGVAPRGQIRAIQGDSTGNIWFVSGFSLFRYHPGTRQLEYFSTDSFFEASSLCLSPDGTIWAATTDGYLQRYDTRSGTFRAYDMFSHSKTPVSRWIEKISSTRDGSILVGTSNQGAKQFNIASGIYADILAYNDDHTEIFVRNFLQTADHEYWIATETGIFIYNTLSGKTKNLRKMYNDPYSISDNAVYTFCRDKEGGIWAGTYFGGVNYYPTQYTPFRKYFPKTGENSLSGNVVREIHADPYNNLWIGTEDAGLNRLDPATQTFTHFQPGGAAGSITYTNIHGLLLDGDELWIGTFEHGLDVLNTRTGKVTRRYNMRSGLTALQSNFIYCIYHPQGGPVMLGTTRGAYQYDRTRNDFVLFPGLPLVNWYSCLLQDRSRVFWAGTYGSGVHYYDPSTGEKGNFRYAENDGASLSSDRVNSIFEDASGHLWFATEGGLCRYNSAQKNFTRYTTENGFPSNFMLSILEDKQGNLWISTSRGLSCFNPANGNVKTYTRANGLLSDQFNFNSAYKDASGRMYFGSGKGFISFNPDEFIQNTFAGPVYITGFQVHNRELPIAAKGSPLQRSVTSTEKITLSYHQSTFSIDFALLSYTAPEIAEYAYEMDNLDKNWTYLKTNRKAYFTELAPGTYTFRVKARNSGGVWSSETSLIVEMLPPWWRSWWALVLYAILATGIIWYIIRNYHKRLEAKNRRKIELFEAAKEKEVFKAKIEFFTNVAHEIKTPLTLIKAPLEKVIRKAGHLPEIKDSLSIMERNTNRLVGLTGQLLDFRQTELNGYSLSFVKANIPDLLEEMYTAFKTLAEQRQLELSLERPSELYAYVDIEAFNKILSNLIGNAIKYAATVANIRLSTSPEEDNHFIIEISNDGHLIPAEMKEKIFEPFFRLKETEMQKGTGIGLALSRSLAALHKGTLTLQTGHQSLNVFVLRMPVHQEIEFNLQPGRTNKTITTTNQTS